MQAITGSSSLRSQGVNRPLPGLQPSAPQAAAAATTLGDLTLPVAPLAASDSILIARDRFIADPGLAGIPVINSARHPVGLLDRVHFLAALSSRYGFSLFSRRAVEAIMRTESLALPASARLLQAYAAAADRPADRRSEALIVIGDDGVYHGLAAMPALMAAVAVAQREIIARLDASQAESERLRAAERERRGELETAVGRLLLTLDRHAEGDLSPQTDPRSGGLLASAENALDRMRADLAAIVAAIFHAGGAVNEQMQATQTAGNLLAEGSARQVALAARLREMAAAMVNQSQAGVSEANLRSDAAAASRDAALAGLPSAQESITRLHRLSAELAATGGRLDALQTKVGAIAENSRHIAELADRSHVLAINAAIIAAQSESPGFTVVAREMRALAVLTAKRSQEADVALDEIRRESGELVVTLRKFNADADSGAAQGAEARAALDRVAVALNDAGEGLTAVAGRLEHFARELARSDEAVETLAGDAGKNLEVARQLKNIVGRLAEETGRLSSASSRFRLASQRGG